MSDANLTEREIEVVRLRDEEKLVWREIAERLGTAKGSVNASYRQAMAKIDRSENPENYPTKPPGQGHLSEVKRPEQTAAVLDAATDPFMTIKRAAEECGFPKRTLTALMRRMKTRYGPLNDAIREVKKTELVKILDDKALRCLEYIDDFSMGAASLQNLAVSTGILIDKSQLLQGAPTTITRIEDVKKLDELAEMLNDELQRRGKLIDVTPEKLPNPPPQEVPGVGS